MENDLSTLTDQRDYLNETLKTLQENSRLKDEQLEDIKESIIKCKENIQWIRGIVGGRGEATGENIKGPMKCNIDLNRDRMQIRGPSEDLLSLNAKQLVDFLNEFDCQELMINKGPNEEQKINCTTSKGKEEALIAPKPMALNQKALPPTNNVSNMEKGKVTKQSKIAEEKDVAEDSDVTDESDEDTESEISEEEELDTDVDVFYPLHPGNAVMLFGVCVVAVIGSINMCSCCKTSTSVYTHNALYMVCFILQCGLVYFMAIVRGFILPAFLDREAFVVFDNLLLAAYYQFCAIADLTILYTFVYLRCTGPCTKWSTIILIEVFSYIAQFLLNLATACYIVPAIYKLRHIEDCQALDDTNQEKLNKLECTLNIINDWSAIYFGLMTIYITTKVNI